jgi:hypothetical protein
MITTVTTTTTTAVVTTSTISIAASLGIIGTLTLILFLVVKELFSSYKLDKSVFLSKRFNIVILPLAMMFILILVIKITETLGFLK